MGTAVFVNSLVELTNADQHRRHEIHRQWCVGVKTICSELFSLIDTNGDGILSRDELTKTLSLMVRRRKAVMRGERIINDQLTRVMITLCEADIDFDNMKSAIQTSLSKAGMSEMTHSEFTCCIAGMREPPTREDMMSTDRDMLEVKEKFSTMSGEMTRLHSQQLEIMRQLGTIQHALNIVPLPPSPEPKSDEHAAFSGSDSKERETVETVDHAGELEDMRDPSFTMSCFNA